MKKILLTGMMVLALGESISAEDNTGFIVDRGPENYWVYEAREVSGGLKFEFKLGD